MSKRANPEPAFLTPENLGALLSAGRITAQTAVGWKDVSATQLSIARFYGSVKVDGIVYEYMPGTDELVRRDVAKWIRGLRKRSAAK